MCILLYYVGLINTKNRHWWLKLSLGQSRWTYQPMVSLIWNLINNEKKHKKSRDSKRNYIKYNILKSQSYYLIIIDLNYINIIIYPNISYIRSIMLYDINIFLSSECEF